MQSIQSKALKPEFYWFRSLNFGSLSAVAALTAMFGNSENMGEQAARMSITFVIMVSFVVAILRLKPYVKTRLWARNFRIATLCVAMCAAVLRFCDSDAIDLSKTLAICCASAHALREVAVRQL